MYLARTSTEWAWTVWVLLVGGGGLSVSMYILALCIVISFRTVLLDDLSQNNYHTAHSFYSPFNVLQSQGRGTAGNLPNYDLVCRASTAFCRLPMVISWVYLLV